MEIIFWWAEVVVVFGCVMSNRQLVCDCCSYYSTGSFSHAVSALLLLHDDDDGTFVHSVL